MHTTVAIHWYNRADQKDHDVKSQKGLIWTNPQWRPLDLPAKYFLLHRLAQEFYAIKDKDDKWEKKVAKIFQFCHTTLMALVKAEMSELPLRLFLQGALVLDTIPFENQETVAYEYMSQVSIYH